MATTKKKIEQKSWSCSLDIMPQTKQSGKIGHKHFYTDPKKRRYVETLATMILAVRPDKPFEGLLKLSVVFTFTYRKGIRIAFRTDGKVWQNQSLVYVGDLENLLKPLKDSMQGIVYENDGQIAKYGDIEKRFADKPGIDIWICEIPRPAGTAKNETRNT